MCTHIQMALNDLYHIDDLFGLVLYFWQDRAGWQTPQSAPIDAEFQFVSYSFVVPVKLVIRQSLPIRPLAISGRFRPSVHLSASPFVRSFVRLG